MSQLMDALALLFALLVGHALCDYPLQGDFLAKAKNHTAPLAGVPFYQALAAHALIHGGAVAYLTGSVALGLLETCVHAMIDHVKCEGVIGYNEDQFAHVACKLAYVLYLYIGAVQ